LILVLNNTFVV